MNEVWKNLVGVGEYGKYYKVSNTGKVVSLRKNKEIYQTTTNVGYKQVKLHLYNETRHIGVHTLVALAFIDEHGKDKGLEVNHKDLNKENNNVDNLEWVTHSENLKHQFCKYHKDYIPKKSLCKLCGKEISYHSKYCKECYSQIKSEHIPSKDILKGLILNNSFVSIGKMYGVSDNAVRKWCKKYNLPYKLRDVRNME